MSAKLANLFTSTADQKPPRIAVVGDVMLDCHVSCNVLGISPEDETALKLKAEEARYSPGGAANVALNLKALGAEVTLFGLVGTDHSAATLSDCIAARGVNLMIASDPLRITTTKTRYMTKRGRHLARVDSERVLSISDKFLSQFESAFSRIEGESSQFDIVIVSDYAKGVVTPALMEMLRGRQRPLLVDPKGADFTKYGKVFAVTPNLHELQLAARRIAPLYLSCDAHWLVITKSEEGCSVVRRNTGLSLNPDTCWNHELTLHTNARQRGDPTGCGDSFLAALAYGVAMRWEFETACRLGNAAGAVSFDFTGAHAVSRDQLVRELQSFNYEEKDK